MKRSTAVAAVIAVAGALVAAAGPAQALSVGVYGTVGGGSADWEGYDQYGWYEYSRDVVHTGGGVVLDAPSWRSPLGYRLSLGWERIAIEDDGFGAGYTMKGVVVDQDLTIDLVRGPMRVWVGPELRLGFLRGESDAGGPEDGIVAVGVGPVLGVDVALGPPMAISWKIGYLATGYAGDEDSAFGDGPDDTLGEGHAFVTLGLLFRTWGGGESPAPYDRWDGRR